MTFFLRRPSLLPSSLSLSLSRTFSTTRSSPLAKLTLLGRLADTPELVPTSSGTEMLRYALATSHGKGDNKATSWWKVAAFVPEGGLRDLMRSMGKGSLVYVEGECQMQKFERKEGGQGSALSVVQRTIDIVDLRRPEDASAENESSE